MSIDEDDLCPGDEWAPPYDDAPPPLDPANKAQALADVDRHLRYIAAIERHAAVDKQLYFTRLAELERWNERRMARWDSKLAWHRAPCIDLLAALRAADPKLKTLDLPSGRVKSRTPTKPTVCVDDERAVIAWAETNMPDLLDRKVRVDRRALASYVLTTGELPEGVSLEDPRTSYTIDVSPDEPI
jgi:hypothetical protein